MAILSVLFFLLTNSLFLSLRLGSTVGSFPKPLSAAEEQKYLELCRGGDIEARNILVEHNLRLVAHVIKKYYTQYDQQEDLISIGTIGLIKGISSFDGSKGARLATYAAKCVENEILMHFRAQKKLQGEVSLSDSLDSDKDGTALMLMDVVGSEDTMLEDLQMRETCVQLHRLVKSCLLPREAEIVVLRYGLGGIRPMTQREVAAKFGISRSYVSRIEKKALGKLREAFEALEEI